MGAGPDSGEVLAAALRTQAGHCARLGSPLYADLLERAAVDAEAGGPVAQVLRGHEDDPPDSMLALRLMGAVHRRVLEAALPDMEWRNFRGVLVEDAAAIRGLLDRPVQTNEPGRCAAMLAGFLTVATETESPLRLLEVGPLAQSSLLSPGWVMRSARSRTSSLASRVAAKASSFAAARPSLGLPPTMSRKAFLKRSVRRSGGKRSSARACFFGRRSP